MRTAWCLLVLTSLLWACDSNKQSSPNTEEVKTIPATQAVQIAQPIDTVSLKKKKEVVEVDSFPEYCHTETFLLNFPQEKTLYTEDGLSFTFDDSAINLCEGKVKVVISELVRNDGLLRQANNFDGHFALKDTPKNTVRINFKIEVFDSLGTPIALRNSKLDIQIRDKHFSSRFKRKGNTIHGRIKTTLSGTTYEKLVLPYCENLAPLFSRELFDNIFNISKEIGFGETRSNFIIELFNTPISQFYFLDLVSESKLYTLIYGTKSPNGISYLSMMQKFWGERIYSVKTPLDTSAKSFVIQVSRNLEYNYFEFDNTENLRAFSPSKTEMNLGWEKVRSNIVEFYGPNEVEVE